LTVLQRKVAKVFAPLLEPSRYKAAYGGRGSGKSHFFGEQLIDDSLYEPGACGGQGLLSVCIREVQKSLKDSAKRLLEAKLNEFGLGEKDGFKVFTDRIATPGDGVIIFQGMQDHTAESIKSLEGFKRAWGEEAQTLSSNSLRLLRPTIRAPESEIWMSWNPRLKIDPVDKLFRGNTPPTGSIITRANWNDNPWFPAVLEQERKDCLRNNPDEYDHIWDGGYVQIVDGAYYAKRLQQAKNEGRLTRLFEDPMFTVRLFVDIGGTGAKADSFTIWAAQFIGREIRVLNYYEAQGQDLATHLAWMRGEGYTPDRTKIWLPHDGSTHDKVFDVSYESSLIAAGYEVEVVPNQGKGAAKLRIEEGRRLFPRIWIDQEKCEGGIDALSWYHEKKDEHRDIGLGPCHDWSSHGADSFGLMCVVYEEPQPNKSKKIDFSGWG